jgi:WD40 repeat protein
MLPLPSSGQCHYAVAFSPDGRWLAAGGSAHAVDIWDLHDPGAPARRLQNLSGPIVRVQFATDGHLIAVSSNWVGSFAPETLTFRRTRNVPGTQRAAVSPDGETVVVFDSGLHRRTVSASDDRLDWSRAESSINHTADLAAPGARVVLAAGRVYEPDGYLEIRNAGTGLLMDTIRVTGRPHRVACSADGTLAAVIAHGHLSVWDLAARRSVVRRTAAAHGGWLSVAFDPRGRRVVTGGIDSAVAVWDAAGGPPLKTFQWGVGPVYAVTFDRDGLRAAAAGHAGATVWDVDE